MEVNGQLHFSSSFTLEVKAPSNHWMGGWVGPRAGLDEVAKRTSLIIVPAENLTPVVQPVT